MGSKPGLGVLLLAALLGAIGFWLSNTAADIIFLLAEESPAYTNRGSAANAPKAKNYESRTYNLRTSQDTRGIEGGLTEETTSFNFTEYPTDSKDSPNSTLTVPDIYPTATERYNSSTEGLNPEWISLGPTTVQSPTDIDTKTVTGTNRITHYTTFPSRPAFTEKGSDPDIVTAKMETDKSVCISTSSLTDAEILAIVVGAVFITIVLCAVLFQFSLYMKKKQTHVDNSIYIIENEHNKQDLEANGIQPETRL